MKKFILTLLMVIGSQKCKAMELRTSDETLQKNDNSQPERTVPITTPEEAKHEIKHWFGKHPIYKYKRFGVDE